jgi:hypothetical protein
MGISDARLAGLRPRSLILVGGARPLPAESEAATVGAAAHLALGRCVADGCGLMFVRTDSGDFSGYLLGRDGRNLGRWREGPLDQVLRMLNPGGGMADETALAAAGVPAAGPAASSAGALLIRVFTQAQSAHLRLRFEFRPSAPAHLRYRLDFSGSRFYQSGPAFGPFVHAANLESVLLGGLSIFARLAARRP